MKQQHLFIFVRCGMFINIVYINIYDANHRKDVTLDTVQV